MRTVMPPVIAFDVATVDSLIAGENRTLMPIVETPFDGIPEVITADTTEFTADTTLITADK